MKLSEFFTDGKIYPKKLSFLESLSANEFTKFVLFINDGCKNPEFLGEFLFELADYKFMYLDIPKNIQNKLFNTHNNCVQSATELINSKNLNTNLKSVNLILKVYKKVSEIQNVDSREIIFSDLNNELKDNQLSDFEYVSQIVEMANLSTRDSHTFVSDFFDDGLDQDDELGNVEFVNELFGEDDTLEFEKTQMDNEEAGIDLINELDELGIDEENHGEAIAMIISVGDYDGVGVENFSSASTQILEKLTNIINNNVKFLTDTSRTFKSKIASSSFDKVFSSERNYDTINEEVRNSLLLMEAESILQLIDLYDNINPLNESKSFNKEISMLTTAVNREISDDESEVDEGEVRTFFNEFHTNNNSIPDTDDFFEWYDH